MKDALSEGQGEKYDRRRRERCQETRVMVCGREQEAVAHQDKELRHFAAG